MMILKNTGQIDTCEVDYVTVKQNGPTCYFLLLFSTQLHSCSSYDEGSFMVSRLIHFNKRGHVQKMSPSSFGLLRDHSPCVKLYRAEKPMASSSPSATNLMYRYLPLERTYSGLSCPQ